VLFVIKNNAFFFLVKALSAFGQRSGAGIFPKGFEGLLNGFRVHITAKQDVTMNVDFERRVV